jgi:hypothetical protein
MRFQQRTSERLNVREQWRRDRASAQTLRSAFPSVARVQIHLTFEDPAGASPVEQSHDLHPPARAFFEFPCPYANCDGRFDVSTPARLAMEHVSLRAAGELECPGVRSKDAVTKQACGLKLTYTIAVEYQTEAALAAG